MKKKEKSFLAINYGKKKVIISNLKKLNDLGKFTGLMFRSMKTKNLLFDFNREVSISIHSLFVFFPFLAIWLDSRNRVVEFKVVPPFLFYVLPQEKFRKLIEVPLNRENSKIIELFVGRKGLNIKTGKYIHK